MKKLRLFVIRRLAFAAVMVISIIGCVTNEAGRKQLMLVPADQEIQLGIGSFAEIKKQYPISTDPAANAMLQRVGERIKSVVNLPNAQWEFVVFDSKEVNAFCLPGGKIGVFTGILPITKDEAGLATVLGHEVAHATLHHGAERMSRGLAVQAFGQLAGAYVDAKNPAWTQAFASLYGVGTGVALELPHSRQQESEADKTGLMYMARTGYDPEAAIGFWERFAAYAKQGGGDKTPTWLRTHPDDGTRIRQLKEWMPEAKAQYRPR